MEGSGSLQGRRSDTLTLHSTHSGTEHWEPRRPRPSPRGGAPQPRAVHGRASARKEGRREARLACPVCSAEVSPRRLCLGGKERDPDRRGVGCGLDWASVGEQSQAKPRRAHHVSAAPGLTVDPERGNKLIPYADWRRWFTLKTFKYKLSYNRLQPKENPKRHSAIENAEHIHRTPDRLWKRGRVTEPALHPRELARQGPQAVWHCTPARGPSSSSS